MLGNLLLLEPTSLLAVFMSDCTLSWFKCVFQITCRQVLFLNFLLLCADSTRWCGVPLAPTQTRAGWRQAPLLEEGKMAASSFIPLRRWSLALLTVACWSWRNTPVPSKLWTSTLSRQICWLLGPLTQRFTSGIWTKQKTPWHLARNHRYSHALCCNHHVTGGGCLNVPWFEDIPRYMNMLALAVGESDNVTPITQAWVFRQSGVV